ncbi:hypothetical protein IAG44_32925 [Streptomyces roseirectus]|uniref:Uncharacterized protein n=1 Tax=Streptomyces roseirectus TaxID=2768066 RepID=A0A7H0ILX5_9ACTN|nr:hypothetical protein [Streptomyces roseirectus]QNP73791.1 hypothetical protein IAG44_32925 [Streptomyces roseirectus]
MTAEARVKTRKESVFAERFAVFAECLLTGVWIAVACLGVVTYPAALAAGSRHLGRRTAHVDGGIREFVADFRSALRGGWAVGVAGWAVLAAVWIDVWAVRAGLPGGPLIGAIGVFALIGAAVALLRAAAVWSPGDSWRTLLADAGRRTVLDPAGSFLVVAGLAVVVMSAWFIAPLGAPVLGAVTAAALAVEERYRRR